ncbi:endonuclease/exonuclease/phosphatase family protein [Niabella drilacis]|uniref:Endonuclease/Exonuclease/phosphatase family protein n=1 Tax=Niabella drilacis (strain DSM 25811 / CCM 8410 / CCUG 62505 / LMG 26954 / E90) TaxID=1285928 RepID=A0A1G7BTR3_NIADE|nr:endonuclease/exonuclease/phosphatase [Niabella drilacis]SDE30387.1 Endonuclease/Exonuclease/phosphatase family protein [Niabella drilacis]
MKKNLLLIFINIFCISASAQPRQYKTAIIAFYNLENFYDTIFHGRQDDETFTPGGLKTYTSAVFKEKADHLATVISRIGADINPDGPALLGVSEIENSTVLDALAQHPLLAGRRYRYAHYDSKDARGIDVALFYNPRYFRLLKSRPLYVNIPEGAKESGYTRDILWVTGRMDGEKVHVFVNHWPSRYGGEKRSAPARMAAALTIRRFIDTLIAYDPMTKIIVMGDFNDEPVSNSIVKGLKTTDRAGAIKMGELYNPWVSLYKNGTGTLAYQNAWSLFDQILISEGFIDKHQPGFFFYKNAVFKKNELLENIGPYKGYPLRSYTGDIYRGGYSDHFPVMMVLLKNLP